MGKRIAIIIERANIVLGGAERSTFELSTALSALGFDVDILAAKGQTNAKSIHILCPSTHGKRVRYSVFAEALKQHLAKNQYDIIHSVLPFDFADVYQPRGGTFAESILRNAASYQNKFLQTYKKLTAFANLRRTSLLRAEKKLCKNPQGPTVAALSQYVAAQFTKHYKIDSHRLVVIPNGIRINPRIGKAEADKLRSQILAQLHLKEADNPVFFLFVANNFRLKGLPCLIKAMHLATSRNTERPAYLVIAGRGKSYKYRHIARTFGVHKRIIFLGALRHIQNAISICDAAVLPSFYDASSRFILEALAAAKPVITTKFNGATDLFINDRHGKIIDTPENVDALAEAIDYFTHTENIQKAADAIVTDNLKEEISITRAAQQLKSLYETILEKRK